MYCIEREVRTSALAEKCPESSELWHARFGHKSHDALFRLQDTKSVTGIKISAQRFKDAAYEVFGTCVKSKQTSASICSSPAHHTDVLDFLHMDVC